jgi:flavin reductase (DIM6/NTAB) family NADH-FMN oxidoreductase RutF
MDDEVLRRVLRRVVCGLYVVTTRHEDQIAAGTITWLSRISGQPPILAVSLKEESGVAVLSRRSERFAVHLLAAGQENVAQAFFAPAQVQDGRINGLACRAGNDGMPILNDVPCALECHVVECITPGDHVVVLGEITTVHEHDQRSALVLATTGWYYDG